MREEQLSGIEYVDEARLEAVKEGCIGSPTLFIGVVAAICVAMILYTAPRAERADTREK